MNVLKKRTARSHAAGLKASDRHVLLLEEPFDKESKHWKAKLNVNLCTGICIISLCVCFGLVSTKFLHHVLAPGSSNFDLEREPLVNLGVPYWKETPAQTEFPSFSDVSLNLNGITSQSQGASRTKRRVCFVTFSLVGPTKNGGIATAITSLAEALQESQHFEVTVLYLWNKFVQKGTIAQWVTEYKNRGIRLVPMPFSTMKLIPSTPSKFVRKAYEAYVWLRDHQDEFDMLHFHEWHGPAFYVAQSKHQGLHFQNTLIVTTMHCPSLFYLRGNSFMLSSFNNLASNALERSAVELSDIVISPSAFMMKWVQAELGWSLPHRQDKQQQAFVQQNIVSNAVFQLRKKGNITSENNLKIVQLKELVFFARIEILKGVMELIGALDILAEFVNGGRLRNFDVTFMGNPNFGEKVDAVKFIQDLSQKGKWPFKLRFLTDKLQPEAIAYLLDQPGRVAILPSLLENSPYSVLECIALQIPFLASNVGGTPELIHSDYHNETLFEPNAKAIASHLVHVIFNGLRVAKGILEPDQNLQETIDFHRGIVNDFLEDRVKKAVAKPNYGDEILITICIVHHNRGLLLLETLMAVMQQDYSRIEIVLVDDGSDDEEALKLLDDLKKRTFKMIPEDLLVHLRNQRLQRFKIVRSTNRYPGASRNEAVRYARGDYVAFLDDDDLPLPTWLSTMMHVMHHTRADVVTSMCDFFNHSTDSHTSRWLTLGGSAPDLGMFHNIFGSYSAIFRKNVFIALGGFSEDYGSTFEDWELLARVSLEGYNLELVSEGLLLYRQGAKGTHLMTNTNSYANRMRALRAYTSRWPARLRLALQMGYSTAIATPSTP